MRSLSSIFSSRHLRSEVLLGLLVITLVELALRGWAPAHYSNHEVDKLLWSLRTRRFDSPVVLIGDSVGRQVFGKWKRHPKRFAMLATNQAVGWAGQYFIVKRYLAGNTKPHAVVYMGRPSFGKDFDKRLRENYVERCFTNLAELGGLLMAARDPAMTGRGVLYRLLPSYRYRLHLRGLVPGSFGRVHHDVGGGRGGGGDRKQGLFQVLKRAADRLFGREPINDRYFRKLLGLCSERGIDFIYIPAPESAADRGLRQQYIDRDRPLLRQVQAATPRFFLCDDLFAEYPPEDFSDGTHLNPGPLLFHQDQVVHDRLVSILGGSYLKRQGNIQWR